PIAGWDFFATISDLIGNIRPLPDGIDGGSLRPLCEKGNDGQVIRRTEGLIFHFPWYDNVPMSAIRLGDYKLIKNLNTGEVRLFNLVEDIGETRDLSKSMPAKANELHRRLTDYLKAVNAEGIEDMRAARRKEILEYLARDKQEVAKLNARMGEAGADERKKLEDELRDLARRVKAHQDALGRLERGRKTTSW
ncbi:MAG: hypothetical protein WBF17_08205, partial [Phycisphaerae bacterium]